MAPRVLAFALAATLSTSGCSKMIDGIARFGHSEAKRASISGTEPRLPAPTKDEVLLVEGKAMTLSGFLALRHRFPELSKQDIAWMATAALSLQAHAEKTGSPPIDVGRAVDLARYALGILPQGSEEFLRGHFASSAVPSATDFRRELDRIISQSAVQRNADLLAEAP